MEHFLDEPLADEQLEEARMMFRRVINPYLQEDLTTHHTWRKRHLDFLEEMFLAGYRGGLRSVVGPVLPIYYDKDVDGPLRYCALVDFCPLRVRQTACRDPFGEFYRRLEIFLRSEGR